MLHWAADGRVQVLATEIEFANGLAVSVDGGLLYVAETAKGRVLSYRIAADGSLGRSSELARLSDLPGVDRKTRFSPDGLRIDTNGNLYVCLYRGGGIAILDPAGRLVQMVDVPGDHHTNLAISPDGKFLFGTAISDTVRGAQGSLYRVVNPVAP